MTGKIKIPCDTSNINLIKMTSFYEHSTFICFGSKTSFGKMKELAGWFNGWVKQSSVFKSI